MNTKLALGVPAEAAAGGFVGWWLADAQASRFFNQQDFKIPQAEPSGVQDIVIMQTGDFGMQGTEGGFEFLLRVGAHRKGFVEFLTKPPQGVGGSRA